MTKHVNMVHKMTVMIDNDNDSNNYAFNSTIFNGFYSLSMHFFSFFLVVVVVCLANLIEKKEKFIKLIRFFFHFFHFYFYVCVSIFTWILLLNYHCNDNDYILYLMALFRLPIMLHSTFTISTIIELFFVCTIRKKNKL